MSRPRRCRGEAQAGIRNGGGVTAEVIPDLAPWGAEAKRLLTEVLFLMDSEDVQVTAAEVCLRIQAGEADPGEYPLDEEEPCTCPPDLKARGGFTSSCLACNG